MTERKFQNVGVEPLIKTFTSANLSATLTPAADNIRTLTSANLAAALGQPPAAPPAAAPAADVPPPPPPTQSDK